MITSSKDQVDPAPTKQEGGASDGNKNISKASSSSSTPWLRLKDPRIVRVSRAFGGKDRHSKVCTIRGLRDRRVRLSVPTAIQLYDLQDRLGVNQPSKVVDWLLNAAKNEIDELPPLPIPPGHFGLNPQAMLSTDVGANSQLNKEVLRSNNSLAWEPRPNLWNSDALFRAKSKEVARDSALNDEKEEEAKQESNEGQDFLSRATHHTSSPGLMNNNNNAIPYGPFFHLEPPNFPLSHLGSHGFGNQTDQDQHNLNVVPLPSALSLSSGSHQVLVCPPGATQSYFPSHVTTSLEIDPRQINHFQMLNSSAQNLLSNSLNNPVPYSVSQSMRPFHFTMTPRPYPSQNTHQPDKDEEFPSK